MLPRVLLDVDGVLADFLTPAIQILNTHSGHLYTPDHLQDWDVFSLYPRACEKPFYAACSEPGFCRGLSVIEGSAWFVEELFRLSDVFVVTSPMNLSPTWAWEREQWLMEHFGIPSHKVIHTSAKHVCLGDVLIDDRPANVDRWQRAHPTGVGLLWDAPYNRQVTHLQRVRGAQEALAVVQQFPR